MKLIDIKPLDPTCATGVNSPPTATNEQVSSMNSPGVKAAAPTEVEQGTETDIDIAVSKVFAAETIQDKLDRIAIAMQVIANITLNGVRQ